MDDHPLALVATSPSPLDLTGISNEIVVPL